MTATERIEEHLRNGITTLQELQLLLPDIPRKTIATTKTRLAKRLNIPISGDEGYMSYEEIGLILGYSPAYIRHLERSALLKLNQFIDTALREELEAIYTITNYNGSWGIEHG